MFRVHSPVAGVNSQQQVTTILPRVEHMSVGICIACGREKERIPHARHTQTFGALLRVVPCLGGASLPRVVVVVPGGALPRVAPPCLGWWWCLVVPVLGWSWCLA